MKKEGLLVKRKYYKTVTTQSDHSFKKYPNRIKDFISTGSEHLWVSDMTGAPSRTFKWVVALCICR
jgi:hypothetical protein